MKPWQSHAYRRSSHIFPTVTTRSETFSLYELIKQSSSRPSWVFEDIIRHDRARALVLYARKGRNDRLLTLQMSRPCTYLGECLRSYSKIVRLHGLILATVRSRSWCREPVHRDLDDTLDRRWRLEEGSWLGTMIMRWRACMPIWCSGSSQQRLATWPFHDRKHVVP